MLCNPSDGGLAFVFTRVDDVPRHPAQLYESITYLIAFVILYYVYWNTDKRKNPGYIVGLFFVLVFGSRFYIENFKASQGGFETVFGNALSTGQLLSIPFVLVVIFLMFRPEGQKVGKQA